MCQIKECTELICTTVEPQLSGHPRGIGNWPLNRGWPLKRGSLGIKFWLRENVNLFKYKHALSLLTIVTCNTAITLSSKNHTNPVKNILDKVSTRIWTLKAQKPYRTNLS